MDPQEISKLKTTGYVILTMEILEDKTLSMAEKFVLARITGFDKAGGHYESVENTAAALGLSKRIVQYARKHLEELGYIEIVGYSELGTKLIKVKSLHPEPVQNLHPDAIASSEKGDAKSAPGRKIVANGVQPLRPILKGEERLSSKDKSFEEAHEPQDDSGKDPLKEDEQPKRYGNAEINEILDEWEEATGFSWHSTKQERFAAKNLIAKYGSEATRALVRRVKAARHSDDQFAPQIAKPSQLVGKYEKLTALTMWEERQQKAAKPKPSSSRPIIEGPKVPRFEWERDVREDKTPEELRAETRSIAEKYKGTKFEHLFNGGSK